MITRIWKARATTESLERYRNHFEQNVLPELRDIAGFQKAYLLQREYDGIIDIEVHTLWESLEVIRAFAKNDLEQAVVEPEAIRTVETYDKIVTHFITYEYLP